MIDNYPGDFTATPHQSEVRMQPLTEADRWRMMQQITTVLVGGKYKLISAMDMQKSIEIMRAIEPILIGYYVRIFAKGDEND